MKTLQHAIAAPGLVLLIGSACGNSSGGVSEAGSGGSGQGGAIAGSGGAETGGSPSGGTSTGPGGTGAGQGGSGGGSAGSGATGGASGGSAGTETGGASGSGAAGSGGSGGDPTGEVGTLGGECSPPGALACNGNQQKLTLVCGGSGTWEVNETCEATEFCDSTPGPNAGLCATPDAECEGRMPGEAFCLANTPSACDADGLRVVGQAECVGACLNGDCNDDMDPCLPETQPSCADDCGREPPEVCTANGGCEVQVVGYTQFRLPDAAGACQPDCDSFMAVSRLYYRMPAGSWGRLTVREPWSLHVGEPSVPEPEAHCALPAGMQCLISEPTPDFRIFYAVTSDANAPPRNIEAEVFPTETTCP